MKSLINLQKTNKLNIIDIRDRNLYLMGHIDSAINIPTGLLMQQPEKYLSLNSNYYIYCENGITSNKVVGILNSRGYHTYNISGGFKDYLLSK